MADILHNARIESDEVGSVIAQRWKHVLGAANMLEAAIADPRCAAQVEARRDWLRAHALLLCATPAASRADVGEKCCALAVIYTHESVDDSLAIPMIWGAIHADLDRLGLTTDEILADLEQ